MSFSYFSPTEDRSGPCSESQAPRRPVSVNKYRTYKRSTIDKIQVDTGGTSFPLWRVI
eukprot:jgi/Botrbrau1/3613/Bobra.0204s0009.1